jgi:hypothetical protein
LSIITVYDSNSDTYINDSIQIYKEWLSDYISNVDITDDTPVLDESYPIQRIILYIQLMPGSDRQISNRHAGNGMKIKKYQPEFMLNWITTNELGGANSVRQLSQILKKNTDRNGYLLGNAGLRLATCGGLREFAKSSTSIYISSRQLVTYQIDSSF